MRRHVVTFGVIAVLVVACSASPTNANAPSGGAAASSSASTAAPCTPLAKLADNCPPDWSAVGADKATFCATRQLSEFNVLVSSDACRGSLHYTKYLFDGGPRYCLYDPSTQKLVAYGAFDGKAGHQEWSCGVDRTAFDDKDCAGDRC